MRPQIKTSLHLVYLPTSGKKWLWTAVCAVALLPLAGRAAVTTYTWNGEDSGVNSDWSDGTNWKGGSPPPVPPASGLTTAAVVLTGTVGTSPSVDEGFSIDSLTFDSLAGAFNLQGPDTMTLGAGGMTQNSASNQTISAAVALGAAQTWNINAGSFSQSGNLSLGSYGLTVDTASGKSAAFNNISGTGSMIFTGSGAATISGTANYSGSTTVNGGTLSITGSAGSSTGNFTVDGSSGTAASLGGSALSARYEYIGNSSTGTFNQTAGTASVSNSLYLGYTSGSSGIYNLSGNSSVTLSAADEYIGGYLGNGTGTFNQSGGTNSISTSIYVGYISSGAYNLSGGSFTCTLNGYVGYSGTGTFTQTAGTSTFSAGSLNLGYSSDSNGAYALSGNSSVTLNTLDTYVGLSGTGTFTQTGGLQTISANLVLGHASGGSGTYTLSAGALMDGTGGSSYAEYVGYEGGTGLFTQSGESSNSTPSLLIGANSTGSLGTYTLSGSGTLTAGSINDGNGSGGYGTSIFNLNGGTLTTGGITAGGGTFTFNFNGGTLQPSQSTTSFMSGLTTANVQAGGAIIDTNGYKITISQALIHDTTLGGSLDGGLTKNGTGTLTLTGANTYTGGTTVNGGALSINADNELGDSTGGLTLNGGTLAATATLSSARAITLGSSGGTFDVAGATATTLSGNISGAGGLTLIDSGTLNLSYNANTFGGAVTLNSGTTTVTSLADQNSNSALGTGANTATITIGSSSAATLSYVGTSDASTNRPITIGGSGGATLLNSSGYQLTFTGALTTGANSLTIDGSSNTVISGNMTSSGGTLTKNGAGALALSGSNHWAGNLTINAGVVNASGGASLQGVTTLTMANTAGAQLNLDNNNYSVSILSGGGANGGNISLGSGNLTLSGGVYPYTTYAGVISGTGGINVAAGAYQILSGANTYSGATTISGDLDVTTIANAGAASGLGEGNTINLSGNGAYLEYDQPGTSTTGTNRNINISNAASSGVTFYLDDTGSAGNKMTVNFTGNITSTDNSILQFNGYDEIANFTGTINLGAGTLELNNLSSGTWNFGAATGTQSVTAAQINASQSSGTSIGIIGNVDFNAVVSFVQSSLNTNGYNVSIDQGINTYVSTFTRSGAGNFVLGGSSDILGTFTNSAGNFTLNGYLGGDFTNSSTGTLNFNSGSELDGTFSTSKGTTNFTGATLTGTFTNSGGAVIIDSASTLKGNITLMGGTTRFADVTTYSPASSYFPKTKLTISGGILESQGTFTRTLGTGNGDVSWTNGGFSAVGGKLTVNIGGAATQLTWDSGNFMTASGAILAFGSASADHTVDFENPVALTGSSATAAASRTISVTQGIGTTPEAEIDGVISDNSSKAGSLLKTGDGTLYLNATNTYHGGTTIQAGSLFIGTNDNSTSGGALGDSTTMLTIGNSSTVTTDNLAFEIYGADATTSRNITVANKGATVTLGTASANTGTFGGAITLNKSVSLNAAAGGNAIFNGAISGSGGITKIGDGAATLSAANTYQGNTNIQAGTLFLSSTGSIANSPQINISSGATLAGSGSVNGNVNLAGNLGGSLSIKGNLTGSGSITPGDAPGILTAGSLTASAMSFNFEFTQSGSPDYSNPTDSGNDVLDLTAASNPFTSALTSSDTINIYLDLSALTGDNDTLRGGFFTNDDTSFLSEIDGATINYYIQSASGATTFDGNEYSMLSPSQYNVSLSTISDTADFAGSSGPIIGEVTQINLTSAVPLPNAASAGAVLLGALAIYKRRRGKQ